MANARLKSLTVRGCRSFVSESRIEFPESGMTLFRGKNLDSGGSSGSGKSTLLLAITYLFGFCRFPGTALQSWLTEEPMEITGTVQIGEDELIISRGQKLSLTLNGKKVAGSAKQLEDKLTKLVGLPPELLAALTYRGQKQPGLFLSKTDAEKKEFLTTLLDLGKFEVAVEQSQARVKGLEQDLHTEEYVAGDLANKLKKLKENFKPALVIDEAVLQRQLKEATAALDRIRSQTSTLRSQVKASDLEIETAAAKYRWDAQPQLEALRAEIDRLEEEELEVSSIDHSRAQQLDSDLKQAQGFLQQELEADQVRYRAQRQHADSVHAQLLLIEKRLAAGPALSKQLKQLQAEIAELSNDICDRCKRPWDQAWAQKEKLENQVKVVLAELLGLEALKPQVADLQKQYKTLGEFTPSPQVQELRDIASTLAAQLAEENARIQGEYKLLQAQQEKRIAQAKTAFEAAKASLSAAIDRFRAETFEKLQDAHDQLETMEREQLMAEAHVKGITASLSRVQIDNAREDERARQFERTVQEEEASIKAATEQVEKLRGQLNAELDFQKLIGREGFLGAIFDEVLWEISEETNRLLAQFPNTAHVTLHFRSESTTQKGTTKKAITPVVTIGGFEAPLSSGLSGGMETAVELAVDLAVAQVVSRRTGAVPGWLILDESFTGLGPVEAEASMEILRAFAEDKLVLVVDHASEFKSLFNQFVDVEYQGGYSRVKETP